MVGGIKTGAFEDNPYRLEYFLERFLLTLGTFRQGRVAEFLLLVEYKTAVCASIRINWHKAPLFRQVSCSWQLGIIVSRMETDKVRQPDSDEDLIELSDGAHTPPAKVCTSGTGVNTRKKITNPSTATQRRGGSSCVIWSSGSA